MYDGFGIRYEENKLGAEIRGGDIDFVCSVGMRSAHEKFQVFVDSL